MKKSTFVIGSILALGLFVFTGENLEAKRYRYEYQYEYQAPYSYQYQTPAPGGSLPTLTVSPSVVAPGQTLVLTMDINAGRTWPTIWFTKGQSETAISQWAFPCYQMCQGDFVVSANYVIPSIWANGTDYYAKIYDHVSNKYIKTNFTVQR